MINQKLTRLVARQSGKDRYENIDSASSKREACTLMQDCEDDLPWLDYPIGGVIETQVSMGRFGCMAIFRMFIGLH